MSNNITSGKLPRTMGKGKRFDADMPAFEGDAITMHENMAGEAGRLANIQAQTMEDVTDAERDQMFRAAGLRLPKRKMGTA